VITDDLRRFILVALPSVSHLEAVLLFHARPERTLAADEVGSALYLEQEAAGTVLDDLQRSGVLRALPAQDGPPRFGCAPSDAGLARLIDELSSAYATRLVELTTLIHHASGR
jgi:hypothetical protein